MSDELAPQVSIATQSGPRCANCGAAMGDKDRFCRKCGASLGALEDPDTTDKKWNAVRQLILFFIIEAVICAFSLLQSLHGFAWSVFLDSSLAVTTIVFVTLNWSSCKPLLVWNNFSLSRLALYCFLAVVASCLINWQATWVNEHFFSKRESIYAFYLPYKHAIALTIFFTAAMPAIFEELAFRVFLIGKLLMVTEKNQAAIISGFMFAIMHMSFISLFWLLPFGILLGYIRIKQNTMWYGTCIHFCFNLTACVIDIMYFR